MDINHFDDLGYTTKLKLVFEFFGRNANIILINEDDTIIDALRRELENSDPTLRIILPKAKYYYLDSKRINPYNEKIVQNENIYEGVSSLLYNELIKNNNFNLLYSKKNPVLIKNGKKNIFYCFDLKSLDGERLYFNTLSELLEYYYTVVKNDISLNYEQTYLNNYIIKEIKKLTEKKAKLENDLNSAKDNLKLEITGNLLASNLHLVKKGDTSITVPNYYQNNEDYVINLNPLLSPKKNLEAIFNKYQKAKRAIGQISNQIEITKNEITYYECLLDQLAISKINDLMEIYQELGLKNNKQKKSRKTKPNITTFKTINNDIIYVGKNNIQNNYITHTLASKYDYFFHVQAVSGSHVIVKTDNLTEELKELAGMICAYFSKERNNTNVCVDYTQVRNLKKVPGMKGSFVIYTSYKSLFVKPDLNKIKEKTINGSL